MGSTLFTIGSLVVDTRIAAGIVSGIGFLGAGTIFRFKNRVKGLTTAAGIWTVAVIGFAAGAGMAALAIISTVLMLIILIPLEKIERDLEKIKGRKVQKKW